MMNCWLIFIRRNNGYPVGTGRINFPLRKKGKISEHSFVLPEASIHQATGQLPEGRGKCLNWLVDNYQSERQRPSASTSINQSMQRNWMKYSVLGVSSGPLCASPCCLLINYPALAFQLMVRDLFNLFLIFRVVFTFKKSDFLKIPPKILNSKIKDSIGSTTCSINERTAGTRAPC